MPKLAVIAGDGIGPEVISEALKPRVTACTIDRQMRKLPKPSDHAPVIVTLD